MFCHTGFQANVRKGRGSVDTSELIALPKNGKIKASHISEIMSACDLKPVPRLCTLQELGQSMRKRFPKPQDSITALRLETL